ncbi:unnamed protein product [Protopolystoma xenopodis]|uniref:Uncharacterized protein n=1 Tax=Protopolystoma xenopodis TaxID=117903 RepID=A0A3S5CGA8_9PLAT|nr:unnamed protein product [Protopolystoma xenopodis]
MPSPCGNSPKVEAIGPRFLVKSFHQSLQDNFFLELKSCVTSLICVSTCIRARLVPDWVDGENNRFEGYFLHTLDRNPELSLLDCTPTTFSHPPTVHETPIDESLQANNGYETKCRLFLATGRPRPVIVAAVGVEVGRGRLSETRVPSDFGRVEPRLERRRGEAKRSPSLHLVPASNTTCIADRRSDWRPRTCRPRRRQVTATVWHTVQCRRLGRSLGNGRSWKDCVAVARTTVRTAPSGELRWLPYQQLVSWFLVNQLALKLDRRTGFTPFFPSK